MDGVGVVFVGGPVSPEGAICLARCRSAGPQESLFAGTPEHEPAALFKPITTSIGAVDLHGDPSDAPGGITALRVFAGYSGWGAGQLEDDMEMDGWFV